MAKLAIAFVIGALAASPAWSQGYFGFSVGQAKFKNACAGATGSVTCSGNDSSLRLLGGYRFTPNLALEVGYSELGTVEASNSESARLSAFELSGIASWPIGNRVSLLGRLGAHQGRMDVSSKAVTEDTTVPIFPPGPPPPPPPPPATTGWSTGHSTNVTYGFGASYDIAQYTVRLEWQRFKDLGAANGPKIDVDLFALTALHRF